MNPQKSSYILSYLLTVMRRSHHQHKQRDDKPDLVKAMPVCVSVCLLMKLSRYPPLVHHLHAAEQP